MPSREEAASLIFSLLERLPQKTDLDLTKVIEFCTGKPLSDTAFLVREAARLTAKSGKSKIDQESIDAALLSLSNNHGEN